MKTAEEIVNNCPSVKIGVDDFYGKQTFIKAIELAQKKAYNQALNDALDNAVVETIIDEMGIHRIIHKDSILRLKK